MVLVVIMWSAFRVSRKILPDGVCTANLAGFSRPLDDCFVLTSDGVDDAPDEDVDSAATEDPMLNALDGLANGFGEILPPLLSLALNDDAPVVDDGCCRTAKT